MMLSAIGVQFLKREKVEWDENGQLKIMVEVEKNILVNRIKDKKDIPLKGNN